jgi:hypothetical protein
MANLMSSVLCAFTRPAVVGLALSGSLLVNAQTTFHPQGSEFRIIEARPGDQVFPDVSLSRHGGYVVWQDQLALGGEPGIMMRRLDSSLTGFFGGERVNQTSGSEPEKPKVAVLESGGAVFVWQAGGRAAGDVYARFVSASGTFLTGDVRVNTFTAGVQQDPAVVALPDGTAVVAWSSWDQDGSMQGIYAQRLSSSGQKLGSEFRVNQFTVYNQRNPALTVLSNGDFVVAWISEQQRFERSMDVYARVYSPAGAPLGNEFRVNTADKFCATPGVTGLAEGGFMVAWGQRDPDLPDNGWDVFGRLFNASGEALAAPSRLNAHIYGDQFAPKFGPTGAENLVVWTSLGQDGSEEGVFGRFIGGAGQVVGTECQVNTRTVSKQMHPAVAADGTGKLLVVWTGYMAGSGFDLFAQRYDAVRPLPVPAPPYVFATGLGSLSVTWPDLAGFDVETYEVYVNGSGTPVLVAGNSLLLNHLLPASLHTFRLAYVLTDGRRSDPSEPATGTTWGADLNGDGIPDEWQMLYWGKAGNWPDPGVDSDGDGASDYEEFLAGTNPLDPNSVLRSALASLNGQLHFQWNTQPGMIYQVQSSSDLRQWSNLGAPRFAAGTGDSVPIEKSSAAAYFRVIRVR